MTAVGNLLFHAGVRLSEPLLFGIGEGLGFIYWDMKGMDFPFIGGRIKPDELTTRIASRLNVTLTMQETASVTKAWSNIKANIDRGVPTGLKLDCFHLDTQVAFPKPQYGRRDWWRVFPQFIQGFSQGKHGNMRRFKNIASLLIEIASLWNEVSICIDKAGRTGQAVGRSNTSIQTIAAYRPERKRSDRTFIGALKQPRNEKI